MLLLLFFGCFMYQQYQKSVPRGSRNSDHEEGVGLMAFCRPYRSGLGNRTSDMLDRRRDQRLTAQDSYARGRTQDDDDDGML